MHARIVRIGIVGVVLAGFLAGFAGGSEARPTGKPNLVVVKVSDPPPALTQGTQFTVTDKTKNRGKQRAGPTTTRYYLTRDPAKSLRDRRTSTTNPRTSLTDILLTGDRAVKKLRRGKSSQGKALVTVPGGTPAGRYYLLACADDQGVVAESKETDNCKASRVPRALAPPSGSAGRIDAFSDTYPAVDKSDEAGIRQALKFACIAPTPPHRLTLAQAVASVHAYLTRVAGADAMTAFKHTAEYNNAKALPLLAAASIAAGSPGAALAAELRAHELDPKNPTHLENAAGAAAAIGLPNEAIAFLDASIALDSGKRAPMGISREAADLTTRGYAQLLLGQAAAAEQSLQSALAISPILNEEASMTLAAAKACKGKDPIPAFRKGMRRQDPPEPPKLPMDESKAKATELRPFPFPATAEAAAGDKDFLDQLARTETNRFAAWSQGTYALGLRLQQVEKTLPKASAQRIDDLLYIKDALFKDSDLKVLNSRHQRYWDNGLEAIRKWNVKKLQWSQDSDQACANATDWQTCWTAHMRSLCIPGTKPIYQEWKQNAVNQYNAAKAYQHIWSLRISSLASNVKNQTAYDYLIRWATDPGEIGDEILNLTGFAQSWAHGLDWKDPSGTYYCVQSPDPESAPDPGTLDAKGSGPCPPGLKGISAVMDLGVTKIKINCEEIKQEFSTEMIPLVKAFAEIKYNFKNGTTTVFAGAKAEVGLGPAKADFKSGIYVKGDATSGVKEVGWRVGPSYTVGAGTAQWSQNDYVDIKIIGSYGNPAH
jgi:tetratricopeptide (TPR) repeat protein